LIRSTMALALFRTESDQRINCPIRTNTQRFCLARAVHYQPAPHHPGTRQEPATAMDPETLTEVSVVGPAVNSQEQLRRTVLAKLEYVLAKNAGKPVRK